MVPTVHTPQHQLAAPLSNPVRVSQVSPLPLRPAPACAVTACSSCPSWVDRVKFALHFPHTASLPLRPAPACAVTACSSCPSWVDRVKFALHFPHTACSSCPSWIDRVKFALHLPHTASLPLSPAPACAVTACSSCPS
eukprot:362167-Chlamydomonas_euryale.AAC.1